MKRAFTFSLTLALVMVIWSLVRFDPIANADPVRSYVADTGMVTLGPDQFLRVTAANSTTQRSRVTSITVTFDVVVTFSTCSGGVCTHTVTSQTTSSPVTLTPGQAASHDIRLPPGASSVRSRITSDSPEMQVNALIIDSNTGATMGLFRFYGDYDGPE